MKKIEKRHENLIKSIEEIYIFSCSILWIRYFIKNSIRSYLDTKLI